MARALAVLSSLEVTLTAIVAPGRCVVAPASTTSGAVVSGGAGTGVGAGAGLVPVVVALQSRSVLVHTGKSSW